MKKLSLKRTIPKAKDQQLEEFEACDLEADIRASDDAQSHRP